MNERVPAIALVQRISGALLVLLGVAVLAFWLLTCAYFAYDFVSYISSMLPGARLVHYSYPAISLVQRVVIFSVLFVPPALLLGGLGGFKLRAARALASGSPRGRMMGIAAGVVDVLMCGPSMILGVATLVVLLTPDDAASTLGE